MAQWNKDRATELIAAFYKSVEITADSDAVRNASGRGWRRVLKQSDESVTAYVDCEELAHAVDYMMLCKHVTDNFTRPTVESTLADACILRKAKNDKVPAAFFEDAQARFSRAIPVPINVYMTVYGAVIMERFKVGRFEFIPGDQFDTLELESVPVEMRAHIKEQLWCNQGHVCVTIPACDGSKARELAWPEFQWLECVIRSFIDVNVYDFGITSFDFGWAHNTLAISQGGSFANFQSKQFGCITSFDLYELLNKNSALRLIIENLGAGQSELTTFRKKMRHAIFLDGLSRKQADPSVAYFLCVAALEAMFTVQEKQFVSPGLAQQILEAMCMLVAAPERRRKLFEAMQDAYGKRSAFAHGAAKKINSEELRWMQKLVRDAIIKMLTDPVLSKVKDPKEISELLKDIKFGKRGNL